MSVNGSKRFSVYRDIRMRGLHCGCIGKRNYREQFFFFFSLWDFSLPFRFVIIIVLPRRVGWSTVENLLLFVAFLVRWDTDILLKDSKRKVSNKLDGWKVTEGWWKLKLFGVALIKEKKGTKKCYRMWTKSRNEYYRIFRQSI